MRKPATLRVSGVERAAHNSVITFWGQLDRHVLAYQADGRVAHGGDDADSAVRFKVVDYHTYGMRKTWVSVR